LWETTVEAFDKAVVELGGTVVDAIVLAGTVVEVTTLTTFCTA
jgi:hypothetical protein